MVSGGAGNTVFVLGDEVAAGAGAWRHGAGYYSDGWHDGCMGEAECMGGG